MVRVVRQPLPPAMVIADLRFFGCKKKIKRKREKNTTVNNGCGGRVRALFLSKKKEKR